MENSMSPVGNTSRWVAASRAVESERDDALFKDPYARDLAGRAGAEFEESASAIGTNPYLAIRTKFFDDRLQEIVRDEQIGQVVLLAAGMDTRAFRLDWPDGVCWFEVDRQEIFEHKESVLSALQAIPRCDRRTVTADLEHDWMSAIIAAGFELSQPSVFLVEGLVVYLPDSAVDGLMEQIAGITAAGSWLLADVPGTELLTLPFMKDHLEGLAKAGCPWIFGVADPEGFFERFGWSADVVVPGSDRAHYGRWTFPVVPRSVPGVPRSYLVTAKKIG